MTSDPIEVVIPKNVHFGGDLDGNAHQVIASQLAVEIKSLASVLEVGVGVPSNLRGVRLFNLPPGSRVMAYYVPRNLSRRQPSGFIGRSLETDWARRLEKTGKPD